MSAGGNRRTRRKARFAAALAGTLLATGAGVAAAQVGGGGVGAPDPPTVGDVTCATRCLALRTVTETGEIELTGTGLAGVTAVRLSGADGKIKIEPDSATDTVVTATVPVGAESGKVVPVPVARIVLFRPCTRPGRPVVAEIAGCPA